MIKDSIAILCRGESLKEIELLPDVEEYIIVNGFSDEFELDYIKNVLTDKKITHLISLGSLAHGHPSGARNGCFGAMIAKNNFKQFNIERIVLSYIEECLPHNANSPVVHNVKNKDEKNIPVSCLGDENKTLMIKNHPRYKFTYPSCGVGALGYSSVDLKKKNIYIIGMDFYDGSGYLERGIYKSQEAAIKRSADEGKQMREFFPGFIEKQPEINFTMYTYSDFNTQLNNLNIINLRQ
ncbi:MAG: hypothetical protein CBC24_01555 [Candidatus Pelagibacter sp. TMED64]|nr:hypothetical protein [Candidatus Pelagibacter sp.]OUU67256.1 MAG: hypothetical protein CBC24_01555 [Candidatus Pelagibacter sp. TMED64]|tara:strand:- start:3647 stop:4360 length:714 start_codon:yes stop_codon:yes gene_type:complete